MAEGILGIDAGGTFTDLAFITFENGEARIRHKVKTPTDHDDLASTVKRGIESICREIDPADVRSVSLATTLATNAIVENKLRRVGLILIGYDERIVRDALDAGRLVTERVYRVAGGHDASGVELEPLDKVALTEAARSMAGLVDSVAISGYFSVRNPEHEQAAVEIVKREIWGAHITCGHDLATDLDAVKRATTTVLNAGLIPIVMGLLASVEDEIRARGMNAAVTVVQGDGSLVSADWAKSHPVEMILSGPAGSAVGGHFMYSSEENGRGVWVVDIGGTTTDIIHLGADGRPVLLDTGAEVGGHKTLVKAIDIFTFGLGGDSRVTYRSDKGLALGPRRVIPLCSLASRFPGVLEEMRWRVESGEFCEPLAVLRGTGEPTTRFEKSAVEKLADGPKLVASLLEGEMMSNIARTELERMDALGLVHFASFTPTDALHVLGRLDKWDRTASLLGAKLFVRLGLRDRRFTDEAHFSEEVCSLAVRMIGFNLFRKSFSLSGIRIGEDGEGASIIESALRGVDDAAARGEGPSVSLGLNSGIVGIGAPTWAFIDRVGDALHERAVQPKDADVAGAVGAAMASFSLRYAVRLTPNTDMTYRAHMPSGVEDYPDLETAVAKTVALMEPWIANRAKKAGAAAPAVSWERRDETAVISGGTRLHLWTELTFTAVDARQDR